MKLRFSFPHSLRQYPAARQGTTAEPGLLQVFRLFTGLRLGFLVLSLVFRLLVRDLPPRYTGSTLPNYFQMGFAIAYSALLLVYLSLPWLQDRLGRAFLPISLGMASVFPIVEQYLALRFWTDPLSLEPLAGAWQLIPLLFIPLVLIGAQYNFHRVVAFVITTMLLDLGFSTLAVGTFGMRLFPIAGVIFVRTSSFLLVGYMVVRLMDMQRKQRKALSQANVQLAHYAATLEQLTISRERNRLARELHDTLAHSLSGVAVQLEAVKTLWETSPGESRSMLDQSLVATRKGLAETRRALQALRASPLEDLGLLLAICNLAESVASRAGFALNLSLPEKLENLSPDVEQCIYRVTQEALENVARHAQARNVSVVLNVVPAVPSAVPAVPSAVPAVPSAVRLSQSSAVPGRDCMASLLISDDGQGFQAGDVSLEDHFGLRGMQEWAEMLGGKLEIKSQPGQGTIVHLRMYPLYSAPVVPNAFAAIGGKI